MSSSEAFGPAASSSFIGPMLLGVAGGIVFVFLVFFLVRRFGGRGYGDAADVRERLGRLEKAVDDLRTFLRDEAVRDRLQAEEAARAGREELAASIRSLGAMLAERLDGDLRKQHATLGEMAERLTALLSLNETKLERLREAVEAKLDRLRLDNEQKLEAMRRTVDEKLHETLERRLGESFRQVSERLERVHQGLGEMQALAAGVGDLKRVLTNVKARGFLGEIRLEGLLSEILTADQFEQQVPLGPRGERVDFAVRLPGKGEGPVWLPIDSKFPLEDYQRLLEAEEAGDRQAVDEARQKLEARLRAEARSIQAKYVHPPQTTEFALLFVPLEGLYAEILRRPGLFEALQREFRVVVVGPTTAAALLHSLQMGFRTLAIERRSGEVWRLLGAVKSDFARFAELLDKTQKKLQEASHSLDDATKKTRTIVRRLKDVEVLPEAEAGRLLMAGEEDG